MLKKVKVRIDSVTESCDEGITDKVREIADGYIKYDESGVLLLSYKTKSESGEITTEITSEDGGFFVRRKGAIQSGFLLSSGKRHDSLYIIPPYSFDMTVEATRVCHSLSKDGGELFFEYSMTVGNEQRTCSLRLVAE